MSNPSFPDWAPSAAIEVLHVTGAEAEQQDAHGAAMVRLLTRDDARPGWEAVKKKSERLGRDVDYDVKRIALRCAIAICGPTTSTERMAPTARERWKQDVANRARELADLVRDSGLDREMWALELNRCYDLSDLDPHGFGNKFFNGSVLGLLKLGLEGPQAFIGLPEFLEYIAENAGTMIDRRDLVMGSPNVSSARRAYFARSLTAELMKLYEDNEPMRPVVLAFIRAAFDDPSFEPSQLSRLVPVAD